jgi:hypothetical protein
MTDDELEALRGRVDALEAQLQAVRAQNRRLKQLLAGNPHELATWDIDGMVPLHTRLEQLEGTVDEYETKFQMFVVEAGKQSTPDQRTVHLRQNILNQAQKNDAPIAKLTRSQTDSALGGDLHKQSVLDATKRAADGHAAETIVSSDLHPIGAIEFTTGGTVGRDGSPEQSYLLIDLRDLTGDQARQILTTGETVQGVAD